jgi:hypothetical protein
MFLRTLAVLAILVFATCALGADDVWVVRQDGVGPAKIGMTLSQLKGVLHERLAEGDEPSSTDECEYLKPEKHPGISFMMLDGRFVRADVVARGMATIEGIQVGDSESVTRRTYGPKMQVQPDQYIDNGHYLTIRSIDGKYGVRFETEKRRITSFYAGRFSAIQYVEGCL